MTIITQIESSIEAFIFNEKYATSIERPLSREAEDIIPNLQQVNGRLFIFMDRISSQFAYGRWLCSIGVPIWMRCSIALHVGDGKSIKDAIQLVSLCGMEPRNYYSHDEIENLLYMYTSGVDPVPAATIRTLGIAIDRHPAVFGQQDHSHAEVIKWATREAYIPFLRKICLLYGGTIANGLETPYRRNYVESLERLSHLPKSKAEERARAAGVRALLSELYYQLNTP